MSVTVTRATAYPYALPFTAPVVTARGRFTHRRGWLLELEDEQGRRGWGDAAPWPGFASTDEAVTQDVGRLGAEALLGATASDLPSIARGLDPLSLVPEARHAAELALLDLLAQHRGLSLAALLGEDPAREVARHALVTGDEPVSSGVLKLKVGRDLDADEARLAHLRAAAPGALIRLDAGGAYDLDRAAEALRRFARYGVELIEQPLPPGHLDAVAELAATAASVGILLAADEELAARPSDRVLDVYGGVVLKPMFLGGLVPALAWAHRAKAAGRRVIVTNALESAVGRAGAVHLASLVEGVHGLGSALRRDVADLDAGVDAIRRPAGPGLGIAPTDAWLSQHDDRPVAPPSVAVPNPLTASAAARPHHAALIADGRRWSYRALQNEVGRRAAALAGRGMKAGTRVALIGPRDAEWVIWFHALAHCGAEIAPLDPEAPETERRRLLEALAPAAVLESAQAKLEPTTSPAQPTPWTAQQGRIVVTTSGSTGEPRPIVLTTEQLLFSAFGSAIRLGHHLDDRWLCCLPLHHVGGLSILLRCALYGTTVELHPSFDATQVAEALDDGRVSLVSLVPSMLERVLDARQPRPFPSSLRAILLGGAPASPALRQRARSLRAPVALTWGMTEAASQIATGFPGALDDEAVGPPLPFAAVTVRGRRLHVEGPLVGGHLETADHGRIDDEGRVVVQGRADAGILSGGETIDPAEIEDALKRHPAVADAAVVGLPSPRWGARPHAALELAAGMPRPSDPALATHLREHLARFKVPDQFRWCDALPRTSLGKIARAELRAMLASPLSTAPAASSATDATRATP